MVRVSVYKNEFLITIPVNGKQYCLGVESENVLDFIKRFKTAKTVKIKLQRYDYESDKSLSKFYDIELESVEQAKKVAQAVEREYKYFTGEKVKEEDKPFVLPWRKDKIEVTKEEHKQMDKVSKKQKKLKSTPKS